MTTHRLYRGANTFELRALEQRLEKLLPTDRVKAELRLVRGELALRDLARTRVAA